MATETTHDTAHAAQVSECISGSLVEALTPDNNTGKKCSTRGLQTIESYDDKQKAEEAESLAAISDIDTIVSSLEARKEQVTIPGENKQASSEECDRFTITQDDQHNFNRTCQALHLEEQTAFINTLQEESTTTIEGDQNTLKDAKEHNDENIVTSKENNAKPEEKTDALSPNTEENSICPNVALAKEEFSVPYLISDLSTDTQPDDGTNQTWEEDSRSQNVNEGIAILKEGAGSDDAKKKDRELKDPHDPHLDHHILKTPLLEPCEGHVLLKEPKTKEMEETAASDQDAIHFQNTLQGGAACFSSKNAIAENIHQGELLLHRLRLVQQNQELQQVSDGSSASNTAAMVTSNDVTMTPGTEGEDGGEKGVFLRVENPEKKDSEDKQHQTEAKGAHPTSAHTGAHKQATMEEEVSTDDQSDSGVSADFFLGGIHELSTSCTQNRMPPDETPIQREIRQGLEREQSLRRSRGLDEWDWRSQELVELPVKRSLEVLDHFSCATFGFDAENRLAKRKMLQDIKQEAMKEQALKRLGKVPGFYSRSHTRDLNGRKMPFEAFHQCKKTDVKNSSRCRKFFSSSFTAINAEDHGVQGDGLPFVSVLERTRSLELITNHQFKDSPLWGREYEDVSDHNEYQKKTSDDSSSHENQAESPQPSISLSSLVLDSGVMPSTMDEADEEGSVLKTKNPFFLLRPALSLRPDVEKDIREAMEKEQELRRLRSRLYGDQWNRLKDQQGGGAQSACVEPTSTASGDVHCTVQSVS